MIHDCQYAKLIGKEPTWLDGDVCSFCHTPKRATPPKVVAKTTKEN